MFRQDSVASTLSRIGIIAALPAEAQCLYPRRLLPGETKEIQKNIFLSLSGMGEEAVLTSIQRLLKHDINALISWGIAGALAPQRRSGELLLARSLVTHSQHTFNTSPHWLKAINQYLLSVSMQPIIAIMNASHRIIKSQQEKATLFAHTSAQATDMESAIIAAAASQHDLDFMTIRSIADNARTTLPEAVICHTDNFGRPKVPKFLLSCLMQPRQIYSLLQLFGAYNKALDTLKCCATHLKKVHFLYDARSLVNDR